MTKLRCKLFGHRFWTLIHFTPRRRVLKCLYCMEERLVFDKDPSINREVNRLDNALGRGRLDAWYKMREARQTTIQRGTYPYFKFLR